jgi:tRNA G18 (ribose-2'-O)-methylase SpoU
VPDVVYGTHPVREALRGRREVLAVYCTRRAGQQLEWLPDSTAVVTSERLAELAGSDDHQGVAAEVSPYPYADAAVLLGGDRPLLVALDEVTDPHNLGAVARVCEGAGADGLLITRRRSPQPSAGPLRAPSSTSRSHRSKTLPTRCWARGGRGSGRMRPTPRMGSGRWHTTPTTTVTAPCSCWERRAAACDRG